MLYFVRLLYCCETHYHKLSSEKQHQFIDSALSVRSRRELGWVPCSGYRRAEMKVVARRGSRGGFGERLPSQFIQAVRRTPFLMGVGLRDLFPRGLSTRVSQCSEGTPVSLPINGGVKSLSHFESLWLSLCHQPGKTLCFYGLHITPLGPPG